MAEEMSGARECLQKVKGLRKEKKFIDTSSSVVVTRGNVGWGR